MGKINKGDKLYVVEIFGVKSVYHSKEISEQVVRFLKKISRVVKYHEIEASEEYEGLYAED